MKYKTQIWPAMECDPKLLTEHELRARLMVDDFTCDQDDIETLEDASLRLEMAEDELRWGAEDELRWKRIGACVCLASAIFTISVLAWMAWVIW